MIIYNNSIIAYCYIVCTLVYTLVYTSTRDYIVIDSTSITAF